MFKLSLVAILLPLSAFAQNLFSDPWQPLGNRVHLGVLLGTSLSNDVKELNFGSFKISGDRRIIVGPTVEFDLGRQFAVEADALYRPIQVNYESFSSGGISLGRAQNTSHNWEFPVLAKKYFTIRNWRPFAAGGPSFRYSQRLFGFFALRGDG